MKHKAIIGLVAALLGVSVTTSSCDDMLTPDLTRYTENFSGTDSVYFYLGILKNVQGMVEQNELLGDLRSDLVTTTSYSSDSISNIINFNRETDGENELLNRSAYYKVINQCNFYLAKVDTMAVKNNIYFMRKEFAQVENIRAWAYLQLVQTYGKVPFITQPVTSATTGWEKNPPSGQWATADNLVDLLKPGLEQAQVYERTLGYPSYGTFSTGKSDATISSEFMRFYADLILGDLYLLRGKDRNDYVEAAKNYYYFIKRINNPRLLLSSRANYSISDNGGRPQIKYINTYDWLGNGNGATNLSTSENITSIPSAANSSFGQVLSRSAQIYGFDPSSSNSTTGEGDKTTTSGEVSLTTNYRSRQVAPSEAYLRLCEAQTYCVEQMNSQTGDVKVYNFPDARMHGTAPKIKTKDSEDDRYIVKSAPVSSVSNDGTSSNPQFRYFRSIYRLKQVYLRYAEAINRAGYPRLAFAILRDGLNYLKLPQLNPVLSYQYDDKAKTKKPYYTLIEPENTYGGIYYLSVDELRRMNADPQYSLYLDFTKDYWTNSIGIHNAGCGTETAMDSVYIYSNTVANRMEDEANRTGSLTAAAKKAIAEVRASRSIERVDTATVSPETPETSTSADEETTEPDRKDYKELAMDAAKAPSDLEINAVETLIADEMALETAYEGTRMFDLIRFARHKNNAEGNNYGTNWLAWKIARRNEKLAPYASPNVFNTSLYNLMKNEENWYIKNPD